MIACSMESISIGRMSPLGLVAEKNEYVGLRYVYMISLPSPTVATIAKCDLGIEPQEPITASECENDIHNVILL